MENESAACSTVYVVDDDADVRHSLAVLLRTAGYVARTFCTAKDLLDAEPLTACCIVADVRMPGMDGLEMQAELIRRKCEIPVVIITGHGDIPQAVRAMKAGALDFIEKPFDDDALLSSIRRAIDIGVGRLTAAATAQDALEQLSLLTPRERDVFEQLVAGRPNKVAAYELEISPRTVEIHRARIMDKLKAHSLSDLVRLSLAAAMGGAQFKGTL